MSWICERQIYIHWIEMIRWIVLFDSWIRDNPDMVAFICEDIDEAFFKIKKTMKEKWYKRIDKIIVKDLPS